jgi:hypothetical protein
MQPRKDKKVRPQAQADGGPKTLREMLQALKK